MNQVKAWPASITDRTDDNCVTGWYFEANSGRHYVLRLGAGWKEGCTEDLGCDIVEIDIKSGAVETDKLDKHDKMIFGSKGPMQGGDRVKNGDYVGNPDHWRYWERDVVWDSDNLAWSGIEGDSVEIIPPKAEEGK